MNSVLENSIPIDDWLNYVRNQVAERAPALLSVLDLYISEARFGRKYIDSDLALLAPYANILEVGAGSLLLSCQLVREGFNVTALEPIGDGFSHFNQLRILVLDCARTSDCIPTLFDISAEQLNLNNYFDYAFSINVMEHVKNVPLALERISKSLKIAGSYRFTCPNYLFPYEPHFNIPTLFSKDLTRRFFGKAILNKQGIADPIGTWKSLNWISVSEITRLAKKSKTFEVHFNRRLLISTVERIATDQHFSARRSAWLRKCLTVFIKLRLHFLFGLMPATLQPIMDCVLKKYD